MPQMHIPFLSLVCLLVAGGLHQVAFSLANYDDVPFMRQSYCSITDIVV